MEYKKSISSIIPALKDENKTQEVDILKFCDPSSYEKLEIESLLKKIQEKDNESGWNHLYKKLTNENYAKLLTKFDIYEIISIIFSNFGSILQRDITALKCIEIIANASISLIDINEIKEIIEFLINFIQSCNHDKIFDIICSILTQLSSHFSLFDENPSDFLINLLLQKNFESNKENKYKISKNLNTVLQIISKNEISEEKSRKLHESFQ